MNKGVAKSSFPYMILLYYYWDPALLRLLRHEKGFLGLISCQKIMLKLLTGFIKRETERVCDVWAFVSTCERFLSNVKISAAL